MLGTRQQAGDYTTLHGESASIQIITTKTVEGFDELRAQSLGAVVDPNPVVELFLHWLGSSQSIGTLETMLSKMYYNPPTGNKTVVLG